MVNLSCYQRYFRYGSYSLSISIISSIHTGISLTCVLHDVSRHPSTQHKLQRELQSVAHSLRFPFPTDASELPSPEALESLPLLHAVIKESLRLRNTVPTANPRVTPPDRQTTIGPYQHIPPGVRISCFAWCLHRNKNVYPDPEDWRPERWLDDIACVEERDKWFWTWGSGSRVCIGQSLAMESEFSSPSREAVVLRYSDSDSASTSVSVASPDIWTVLRYAVAAIYTNFSTSVISNECFGRDGSFVTGGPKDKLILKFDNFEQEELEEPN